MFGFKMEKYSEKANENNYLHAPSTTITLRREVLQSQAHAGMLINVVFCFNVICSLENFLCRELCKIKSPSACSQIMVVYITYSTELHKI